ncbi:MAG: hypothetical protein OYG31_02280 [Candidatus Kaiserbacteria bacterium]|nr:hypothetical protein [Candidatus Kaiserbacteria bacterium]
MPQRISCSEQICIIKAMIATMTVVAIPITGYTDGISASRYMITPVAVNKATEGSEGFFGQKAIQIKNISHAVIKAGQIGCSCDVAVAARRTKGENTATAGSRPYIRNTHSFPLVVGLKEIGIE